VGGPVGAPLASCSALIPASNPLTKTVHGTPAVGSLTLSTKIPLGAENTGES